MTDDPEHLVTDTAFDFQRNGYFADFPKELFLDDLYLEWRDIYSALDGAKNGKFETMHVLVRYLGTSSDPFLNMAAATLLSDAAPGYICDHVASLATQLPTYERARYAGKVLAGRATLADVEVLLELALRFSYVRSPSSFTLFISDVIDDQEPMHYTFGSFASPEDYAGSVKARCREIEAKFGKRHSLFEGEPFSVATLARKALTRLERGELPADWRQKFEATTGIDCSSFYADEMPQPLAAAALLEDFLESGKAELYEPGVRYFFGHRIPH